MKRTKGVEAISKLGWNEFKEIFLLNFSPEAEVKRIRREFLVMHQTTQSVSEFTSMFVDRARGPEYMDDEKRLMEHYRELLKKETREFISTKNYQSFMS